MGSKALSGALPGGQTGGQAGVGCAPCMSHWFLQRTGGAGALQSECKCRCGLWSYVSCISQGDMCARARTHTHKHFKGLAQVIVEVILEVVRLETQGGVAV